MKNMKFLLKLFGTTVLAAGSVTSVVACNNNAATASDISSGVSISDLTIVANSDQTFSQLNSDLTVTSKVALAINAAKSISAVAGVDFIIVNDQQPDQFQSVGATVQFTVIAIGSQIKGSFDFVQTLSKPSISQGVNIDDPNTSADPNANYRSLNNRSDIQALVASAINDALGISVQAGTDFNLSNDQVGTDKQAIGTKVTFTVAATGNQIAGNFTFVDTLGKADISNGVVVNDLKTGASLNSDYNALNTDSSILNAVVTAINTNKHVNITANDINLSNDQLGKQAIGQKVRFNVVAKSDQITGSFSFVDTLGKVNIGNGVSVADPLTTGNQTATYGALNSNAVIVSRVLAAINAAKGASVSANDITITNDQIATANQVIGTKVTFTVTANPNSSLIAGSFNFTNTLGKTGINAGVIMTDPATAVSVNTPYTALNTNANLITTIVNAINAAKGTTITASDITLSNNKTGNQVVGAQVLITVTANASSNQIWGSFSFIDTLSKVNISSGVTITDPITAVNTSSTFAALNDNATIKGLVATAINTAYNTNVTTSDFTLTNNQNGTQVPNSVVTFTVSANPNSGQITGSFTFIDTLGKVSISTGVNIADPGTAVDVNLTYGALNTLTTLTNTVTTAINNAKNVNVTAGVDYTLSNNQTSSASQVNGTVVTFTVTATASGKLTGSFTFTNTLRSVSIASGVYIPDLRTPANSAATYGAMNSLPTIVNAVTNAILYYKNVSATNNVDFIITNNFNTTRAPAAGDLVLFTVTGTSSGKLAGLFTFYNTIT